MKCKSAQFLLNGYVRGELNQAQTKRTEEHMRQCAACRASLEFHRNLDTALSVQTAAPPASLERALNMYRLAPLPQRPWLAAKLGDSRLRKTFLSTATVLGALSGVLLLSPVIANANGPQDLFRSMKAAMKSHQKDMEVVFTNGTITMNLKPSDYLVVEGYPLEFTGETEGGLQFKGNVDLNEQHYKSISYGKDMSQLVLVPKKDNKRYEVTVDAKSNLPRTWTAFSWDPATRSYKKVGGYKFTPKR